MNLAESSGENVGQSKELSQEARPVNLRLIMANPGKDNQRRARIEHKVEQLAGLAKSDSDQQVVVDGPQLYQLVQEAGYERIRAIQAYDYEDNLAYHPNLRLIMMDSGGDNISPHALRQYVEVERMRRAAESDRCLEVASDDLYVMLNQLGYVPSMPIDWSAEYKKRPNGLLGHLATSVARVVRALPERD